MSLIQLLSPCFFPKEKRMKSSTVFVSFLTLHLLSIWVVQTSYVPDEYWQTLEIAHNLVFGYGYKTWEWTEGIRSYFYPSIIAIFYKALSLFGLDTVFTLTVVPRVLQAVISAVADHQFWKWICQQTGCHGQWATFSLATAWFWFYCGSRTLSNTLETALTMMALQAFPWSENSRKAGSLNYLWFVAIACITRPTASIIWVPLCTYHFITSAEKKLFIGKSFVILSIITAISTSIDSYCYNRLIFTPWNFLKANILDGVGSFYGSQPYHWYLTQGLPAILGLHTLPFILGIWQTIQARWRDVETPLICVILWTLFVYSLLPHKEFRFLLPLIPMALFISSEWISRWSRTAYGGLLWASAILLLAGSIAPSYYFGMVHQQGTVKVMSVLAETAANSSNTTNVLFLMPCHSTPFYSHVHINIPMRFLTCEPNLQLDPSYVDEADVFFTNPLQWLEKEFPEGSALPSHVVIFDTLQAQIQSYLKLSGFTLKSKIYHAHPKLIDGRVGENVLVYHKK